MLQSPTMSGLEWRMAFEGPLGDVLERHLQVDIANSRLPAKFRYYYALRPFLPAAIRRILQRCRNQSLPVDSQWFINGGFAEDWRKAVQAVLQREPDCTVAHPWPVGYQHAIVLTHDIETREGLQRADRLARLEEQAGMRSAWFVIPHKYKVDLGLLRDLQQRGHEVGLHGWKHDGRLFSSQEVFRRRASHINRAARQWGSVGFRAPMVHRNLEWMQDLEIDYDASCFDVDPFQAMPGGVGGVWPFICGRFVELPYTLPQDHTLFALRDEPDPVWREKYAWIRQMAGMALSLTHPDYLDSPPRIDSYRRLLDQFAAHPEGWKCLPRDVTAWWRRREATPLPSVRLADLFSGLLN